MRNRAIFCADWLKELPKISRFLDFFQWLPPLSWIFLEFKFVTIGKVKRVELRHRAKLCQNR